MSKPDCCERCGGPLPDTGEMGGRCPRCVRRWALSLLERVMGKLRAEFAASGKDEEFDSLAPFLNKDSESGGYQAADDEMGVSAGALRMSVHRMRRKYRQLLRAEIAETVSRPEEIEGEIRFLLSVLSV